MWPPTRPMIGVRGLSSVGRALPLQGRSQGFESPRLHKRNQQVRGYFTARSGGRETSETPPVPTPRPQVLIDAVGTDQDVAALRIVDPARTQRRSRDRHGVVKQSHDPTGQGVGVASDTELDERRKAVVVDAFANEVGAIELEDRQHRHVDSAADRWQAPKGSPVGAVQARFSHHAVTVVTQ
jgi:hypothetical protein